MHFKRLLYLRDVYRAAVLTTLMTKRQLPAGFYT